MRKLLIAFAATLVATVSVFAAQFQGIVAEVDDENRTVTLDDGSTVPVADDASGEITEIAIAE